MADAMDLEAHPMSMSLGEFSPPSSPSSSPPLSPQYMGESQPQRDCRELLKDPDGTNLFRAYLKGAYASEVLNLWIEIQLYKNIGEQEKMQKKGQYIYDKYCCREGACEVNLDESLRVAVKMALDNSTLQQTTFNNIQTHVFDLLWTDCFMGFRHTDVYSKYITQRNSLAAHRRTLSPGIHITDYMRKINFITNSKRSLTDSQRNLQTYFSHMKKTSPLK